MGGHKGTKNMVSMSLCFSLFDEHIINIKEANQSLNKIINLSFYFSLSAVSTQFDTS